MTMQFDLDSYRRFFAEEIQVASNIRTPGLVDALATVPRERFLPPGPWIVRGEADMNAPLRRTPSDDPRFTYHNVSIAVDPDRMLFNGAPGFVAASIDALGLEPGQRVLHVGAGTGYYTALMARAVGPSGRVHGIEVDPSLARQAAENVTDTPWATVQSGDGRNIGGLRVDAIFVNAGVTHPEPAWLHALGETGRMVLPLTASMPMPVPHPAGAAMANISRGLMMLVTATGNPQRYAARVVTFVGIYSAVGLRDDDVNATLTASLKAMAFPQVKTLRLDAHEPGSTCWCHTAKGCWSTES